MGDNRIVNSDLVVSLTNSRGHGNSAGLRDLYQTREHSIKNR